MKKLIIGVVVVIVLLIAAVIAIPFLVPVSVYKDRVVAAVKEATGRDLVVNGPIGFTVFPMLGLTLEQASFSDVSGAPDPMVSLSKLHVALKTLPLLSGQVVIDGLEAVDPVIRLTVAQDGTSNWVFAKASDSVPVPSPESLPSEPPSSGESEKKGFDLRQLSLSGVSIVNGTVIFTDRPNRKVWTAEQINLALSLPGPDAPLDAKGELVWNAKKAAFSAHADRPFDLLDGRPTGLDVVVSSEPLSASYKGTFGMGALPAGAGTLALDIPSLKALAVWLDVSLPSQAQALQSVALSTRLDANGTKATLNDLTLSANNVSLVGSLSAEIGGERPYASAAFELGSLDLRPYLVPAGTAAAADDTASSPSPSSPAPETASATASGTMIPKGIPALPPEVVDLLRAYDADVVLGAGPLILPDIRIDRAKLTARLKDGVLDSQLSDLAVAQGQGSGRVVLDARHERPPVQAVLSLEQVQLEPLAALAGQQGISGVATANASLAGWTGTDDLKALNADVKLAVAQLVAGSARIERANVTAQLKDGRIVADISDLAVAQGSAKAQFTVDTTANPPPIRGTVALSQMRLAPLLALAGQQGIDGIATTTLNVAAQGRTVDELMKTGTAKGDVALQSVTAPAYGINALALTGTLDAAPSKVSLANLKATVNDLHASGSVGATLGAKPAVTGNLDLGRVDVNALTASFGGKAPSGSGGAGGGGAPVPQAAPQPQGDWNNDPIDFTALRTVDANVTFNIHPLIVDAIQIDRLKVAAVLKNGTLTANIQDIGLYQGAGKGKVTVNAAGQVPSLAANLSLSGVQTQPLLKAAVGLDKLTGQTTITANVTANGASQKALVSSLGGNGSIDLRNGAIKGVDLGRVARNLTSLLGGQQQDSGQTEFSRMHASFSIANGIVTNPDLVVESPVLLLQGKGTVNLPQKSLNVHFTPKKVPAFESQKGLQALLFPVLVSGPWSNPTIAPDLKAAFSDPQQILERVENLKDLKDLPKQIDIPGLLNPRKSDSSGGSTPTVKPKDVLKDILRKR